MINAAELLKDCPKGTELDCVLYGNVTLFSIDDRKDIVFPIRVSRKDGDLIALTKYGQYSNVNFAKCVIFPKGKTTWEGFKPPCKFKDGDIIYNQCIKAVAIFYKQTDCATISHCYLNIRGELLISHWHCKSLFDWKLATEEEKQKLFNAIKASGYKWNPETKTLETLIIPKFKVGDRIKNSDSHHSSIVVEIKDDCFIIKTLDGLHHSYLTDKLPFSKQVEYELVTDKFNINTLKPFDRVLVRGNVGQRWTIDFFGFMDNNKGYPFVCVGHYVAQCIPYEGNEHLLGKTDDCDEYYKTWG